MNQVIKWGILGAGGIAKRRTLPAVNFLEKSKIIAIMDVNTTETDSIAKEYNIDHAYYNEDDLLNNPDIDAVYIASPVSFHLPQAKKVIKSGKHLLVEKPLGLNLNEAKELTELAAATKLKTGAAMVMRFHDGHKKIAKIVREGKLGDIVSCRAQLSCWFPDMDNNWRQSKRTAGGGALTDMGIHCIDILGYILQDTPKKVCGFIETKTFNYEVEDSVSILLKMNKGAYCYIDTFFNIPDEASKCMLEIYGTKGSVIASGTLGQDGAGEITLTLCDDSLEYSSAQNRTSKVYSKAMDFKRINIYAQQLDDFSKAILNDLQPSVTIEEACEHMRIIDMAYKASYEEKVLML